MIRFLYFVICPLLILRYFIQFQQYLRVFDPISLGLPLLTSAHSACRSLSANCTIYLWFTFHHPTVVYHFFSMRTTSIY